MTPATWDLTRFTRTLMRQVERDLRCEVDWVAASHFNTAHPHVHIAVRGGDPQTDELIIARRYLTHGLRHRIEETLTAELGYRRGLERAEDLARAVSEDRFTGLDADLERAAPSGEIDLSGPAGRSSGAPWSARVGRLCHLRGRGLAEHAGGPLWRLQPGWADALKAMGQRAEAERDMARLLGERVGAGHLHTLPPGAGVTGRLAGFIAERTATGRHFIVIEGLDGRAWSAPVTARTARGLPAPGSVVTLTAVPAPLSREAGAAGAPSQGAGVRIDAWIEIGQQVRRAAYTWLDTLDEAALDGAAGFGADVRAARLARQLWLRAQGLYPAQRAVLTSMELEAVAASQAARLGKTYDAGTGHGAFQGKFAGHVDTAQGRLAIVESRTRFALAAWPQDSAPVAGQEASIVRGRVTFGRVLGRSVT
ncbi:MAG: DUF3363 domain-containing protein [Acidobacteria bacterium]|nr:DUF3363 domain-containing protein [Acidobacteriota bacterium]